MLIEIASSISRSMTSQHFLLCESKVLFGLGLQGARSSLPAGGRRNPYGNLVFRILVNGHGTECPKNYRKSVQHLLKYTANLYLSRCGTDLR